MFDLSFSDEGASGGDTSQLFHTVLGSSPVTSPPLAMDHDDGFILDNNLFDILPSTPTLPDTSNDHPAQVIASDMRRSGSPQRSTLASQDRFNSLGCQTDVNHLLARPKVDSRRLSYPKDRPEDQSRGLDADPLAELEAWLQSGAVELAEE